MFRTETVSLEFSAFRPVLTAEGSVDIDDPGEGMVLHLPYQYEQGRHSPFV